jgi:hypothetical protein
MLKQINHKRKSHSLHFLNNCLKKSNYEISFLARVALFRNNKRNETCLKNKNLGKYKA